MSLQFTKGNTDQKIPPSVYQSAHQIDGATTARTPACATMGERVIAPQVHVCVPLGTQVPLAKTDVPKAAMGRVATTPASA